MTDTLPRLLTRTDRPVDPLLIDILRRVNVVARAQGIDYFVGGALARDLVLRHVFGKDTGRATRDVDLGICLDDWSALDSLKAGLIQGGRFAEQAKFAHRLIYRASDTSFGIPLDLLPFGGVEGADATVAWPPGMDIVMNVAGFSEARTSALMVDLAEGVVVPVASLPSIAILKLIAWRDRHLETAKDASDFLLIARSYHDAGNADRLYDTESALLQASGFDPDVAGAMLLGKDAMALCLPGTAQSLESLLNDSRLRQLLIDQILRMTLSSGDAAGSSRVERYLDAFNSGFGSHKA